MLQKHDQYPIFRSYPAGIYLLKVNNRNTKRRCEIYSKLTIKTPERRHWRRSDNLTDYGYIAANYSGGVYFLLEEISCHLVISE